MSKITAAITAVGGYVPDYVLSNQVLETLVDTNDEWITTRTGIKAVSYTHLDVYKRQVLSLQCRLFSNHQRLFCQLFLLSQLRCSCHFLFQPQLSTRHYERHFGQFLVR